MVVQFIDKQILKNPHYSNTILLDLYYYTLEKYNHSNKYRASSQVHKKSFIIENNKISELFNWLIRFENFNIEFFNDFEIKIVNDNFHWISDYIKLKNI